MGKGPGDAEKEESRWEEVPKNPGPGIGWEEEGGTLGVEPAIQSRNPKLNHPTSSFQLQLGAREKENGGEHEERRRGLPHSPQA